MRKGEERFRQRPAAASWWEGRRTTAGPPPALAGPDRRSRRAAHPSRLSKRRLVERHGAEHLAGERRLAPRTVARRNMVLSVRAHVCKARRLCATAVQPLPRSPRRWRRPRPPHLDFLWCERYVDEGPLVGPLNYASMERRHSARGVWVLEALVRWPGTLLRGRRECSGDGVARLATGARKWAESACCDGGVQRSQFMLAKR